MSASPSGEDAVRIQNPFALQEGEAPSKVKDDVSSMKSESSTIFHHQKSFQDYKVLVGELCNSLWPAKSKALPSIPRSSTRSKLRGQLRKANILQKAQPAEPPIEQTPGRFAIERLKGGTYNRIIGIKVRSEGAPEKSGGEEHLILRAPRQAWEADLETEVATLRYVRQHAAAVPIPHVKAFDLTDNNPLDSIYSIQTRLPGMNLQQIYPKLSHNQNKIVVKEVCKIILALQAVTHPVPGLIQPMPGTGAVSDFTVRPFDLKSPFDTKWKEKPRGTFTWEPKANDAYDFFTVQFGRWFAKKLLRDPRQIAYWDYQSRFMEAARQMNGIGLFKDQGNCLCHLDLYARNILVLPDDESDTVQVTGVLDWDSAIMAPKFVSCGPPWWLWQCDSEETGSDWDELDEGRALEEPKTLQGVELLDTFEEVIGEDFLWLAYEPQFRLARQLFRLAVGGLHCNEDSNAADEFLDEWKEFYDGLMKEAEEKTAEEEAKREALDPELKPENATADESKEQ